MLWAKSGKIPSPEFAQSSQNLPAHAFFSPDKILKNSTTCRGIWPGPGGGPGFDLARTGPGPGLDRARAGALPGRYILRIYLNSASNLCKNIVY